MNRNTPTARVGTTQRRSLGLSAGRKNARISHSTMGEQTHTAAKMATRNLMEKPPRGELT